MKKFVGISLVVVVFLSLSAIFVVGAIRQEANAAGYHQVLYADTIGTANDNAPFLSILPLTRFNDGVRSASYCALDGSACFSGSDISNIAAQISGLSMSINALTNRVSNLESRMNVVENDITDLSFRVDATETDISSLVTRVQDLEYETSRLTDEDEITDPNSAYIDNNDWYSTGVDVTGAGADIEVYRVYAVGHKYPWSNTNNLYYAESVIYCMWDDCEIHDVWSDGLSIELTSGDVVRIKKNALTPDMNIRFKVFKVGGT